MISVTLTNTGDEDPNDYVEISFVFPEEAKWSEIVNKVIYQGLPALDYVLPDTTEEVTTTLYNQREGIR